MQAWLKEAVTARLVLPPWMHRNLPLHCLLALAFVLALVVATEALRKAAADGATLPRPPSMKRSKFRRRAASSTASGPTTPMAVAQLRQERDWLATIVETLRKDKLGSTKLVRGLQRAGQAQGQELQYLREKAARLEAEAAGLMGMLEKDRAEAADRIGAWERMSKQWQALHAEAARKGERLGKELAEAKAQALHQQQLAAVTGKDGGDSSSGSGGSGSGSCGGELARAKARLERAGQEKLRLEGELSTARAELAEAKEEAKAARAAAAEQERAAGAQRGEAEKLRERVETYRKANTALAYENGAAHDAVARLTRENAALAADLQQADAIKTGVAAFL